MHWTLTEVLSLDHSERRRWVAELGAQHQHHEEAF
jgi:hypothetical protein